MSKSAPFILCALAVLSSVAQGQEEVRISPVTKEEVLRRLIAVSFQAKEFSRIPEYYLELKSQGARLAVDDYLRWGKGLELAGRPAEAFQLLSPLLAGHPEERPLIKEVAQLAVQARRFEVAARLYGRLSELEPDLRTWPLAHARALLWSRKYRETEAILEKMIHEQPDRNDPELKRLLAEVRFGLRQYVSAARLLEELLRDNPEDEALERKWIEALAQSGETNRARERLILLRARHPKDRGLTVQAADLAATIRRFPDAILLYEEALTAGEKTRDTRLKLARAMMSDGRIYDALRIYDRLEWEDPLDWEIGREKARMLGWKQQSSASLFEYDRLITSFPDNLPLRSERRAKAAMYQRNYSRAITEYEEVLRLEPANHQALTDLADLYSQQDMWEEARKAYQRAQDGDPDNPALREARERLDARRDAVDTRFMASFSDQQSPERKIFVRNLFAGASVDRWMSDSLRVQGRFGVEQWGFQNGVSSSAIRADAVAELVHNPSWSGTLDVGYRQYDIGVKAQILLDGRLRYKPAEQVEVLGFVVREDFSKNAQTFFDDLYSVSGGFGGTYHVSERVEIDALTAIAALTDGNGYWSMEAKARYRVFEGVSRLEGHYRIRFQSFREELPTYFSPTGFSQQGLGLVWRLDLSETVKPSPYLELGYEIMFDSGASVGHLFLLGHRYRLAKTVELGLDLKAVLGDVYEEKRGELFVSVAF